MLTLIYLFLAILFLVSASLIIFQRRRYLISSPEEYDPEYDGHNLFLEMSFATVRFFGRRVKYYLRFTWQYVLHLLVGLTSLASQGSNILYGKIRNKFLSTAIKNKRSVTHFWNSLKKYKREIDQEKENGIYDSRLDSFSN